MLGLGGTALHVGYWRAPPPKAIPLLLGEKQYQALLRYLDSSFARDAQGAYVKIRDYSRQGRWEAFYAATGRYTLARTCNTWTNTGLKLSGQRACMWTPFAQGILYQYRP